MTDQFPCTCTQKWQMLKKQSTKLKYCILAYKPTKIIFDWILMIKLWGSAYMRVMPHSHTLTARVSKAWTISRPLGLRVGMGACAVDSGTTHCIAFCIAAAAVAAHQLKSSTVTWYHSNTHTMQSHHSAKPHTSCQVPHCHVHTCCSRCCELVDTQCLINTQI